MSERTPTPDEPATAGPADLPASGGPRTPFRALREALDGDRTPIQLRGLEGAARGYVLARLQRERGRPLVCVASDEDAAERLAGDLAFFLGGAGSVTAPRVLRLPAEEVTPYDALAPDGALMAERLGTLFHLRQGTDFPVLVLSVRALRKKVLPPTTVGELSARLAVGEDHPRDPLARKLVAMGYHNAPLVEDPGTFSVRGDIVDVFSPLHRRPVRIELFGDTVESLRAFDPDSQRTVETLEALVLGPARELLLNEETLPRAEATLRTLGEQRDLPTSQLRERIAQLREGMHLVGLEAILPGFFEGGLASVFEYLPFWAASRPPLFYVDDPVGLTRASEELDLELARGHRAAGQREELTLPPDAHYLPLPELERALAPHSVLEGGGLALGTGGQAPITFNYGTTRDLREAIRSHHGEEGALTPLVERLERWRQLRVAAAVACGTPGQADRLRRLLVERELNVKVHEGALEDLATLHEPHLHAHLFIGEISRGFVDAEGGLALFSDEEIFGVRARRKVRTKKLEQALTQTFRELKEGDLIVHREFGIGRYAGLVTMDLAGIPGDFLALEYAGRDKVYLPVGRMRLVQKLTGGDPSKVTLDRLGGTGWERTKRKVKESLLKMAAELLRLYAARHAHPGFAFSEPDRYYRQFEADFEFEETPDQGKAIDDVLSDMRKPQPMDRLVCGDVGYGKTEVAMRAAFKAALDQKQTAVLVPTTVLAQQHYNNFKKRFGDYPITLDVVSRMRSTAENRKALQRAREGKVDVLIGTHKLLGGDVGFKSLGLLIIDEEQRFGVKQKEQLRKLKTQVDCLTLTATPIPRTMNQAMSGVRDMSIIATPPTDRRAIRTFVLKHDPDQIREAILREVRRGGQVFYVHNRIESLQQTKEFLQELVPEVTLEAAHGQMKEGELEKVMTGFVERRFQLLLCTAIIESGLDIPSANTMIVDRADTFGLAQLYQLRGRVGRSRERAYAYLLVPARKTITREAQQRLEVLQTFTELGAGFSIASHDLEIRGAGNLLGKEQSGAIAEIGFDLYSEMLEEAVAEMKGEPLRTEIEPEVTLPLPALIPDDYVPDVHQRLNLYKRMSAAASADEVTDLRAELVDRFGELPPEVDNLTELTLLKLPMRELALRALEAGAGKLVVTLGTEARLDPKRLAARVARSGGAYRLTPDMKLTAKIPPEAKGQALLLEARRVLDALESCAL